MSFTKKLNWYLKHQIKNFNDQIGQNSYYRAWQQMQRAKKHATSLTESSKHTPILIYQMGKVGSTTILNSLKEADLPNPIAQVHRISDHIGRIRKYEIKKRKFPPAYHIDLGLAINQRFKQLNNQKPFFKVISLVRDPIAFEVSKFFQNPHFYPPHLRNNSGDIDTKKASDFLNDFLLKDNAFIYVFNWFDQEIKSVFELDVFAFPFDKDQGWTILRGNNIELLLIRLENLSKIDNNVLTNFVNSSQQVELINSNVRNQKTKNNHYDIVKDNIKLDRKVCEKIYSHKFAKHFYKENEVQNFIEKWSK